MLVYTLQSCTQQDKRHKDCYFTSSPRQVGLSHSGPRGIKCILASIARFDSGAPMFPDKVKGFPGFGIVSANGDVNVVPTVAIQAICEEANLADLWAEQNCTLRYGSWTYSGYKLDIGLHYEKDQVDLSQYAKSSPLEARKITLIPERIKATVFERKEKIYDCCPEPYVSME
eukprot:maker-scaffold1347_size46067-snap-gene-0.12 protein:Tk02971 transcript:maker-scaffold1347_size46067-snap-gene-0.12-mRNA-1 annotation:"putative uncharacterized protein"